MSGHVPTESPSALGRVDEVCLRFEAAWKAHAADSAGVNRPRMEEYLAALPEADRPLLERELRAVDDGYVRRLGGDTLPPPTTEDGDAEDRVVRVRYFGDYELLEKIASGGFGVVFKARQVSLNRVVALKMIRDGRLATPELVQRFRLEAEAAAGLEHEGIVPVYEVGAHDGQHYFSMKLVEGGSLTAHVQRYRDDRRGAAALMARVARAVHHAHQCGVLHRDLKPGNILLDGRGLPQVTDFGLAKLLDGGPRTRTAGGPGTVSGAVVGTPGYMAPEQVRGLKGVTTAADVYGLGAVMYELLTGRPPFKADTPLDALLQALEREPDRPRSVDSHIDRDLETVCLKCLEKDPDRRYGTAASVAEELERWLNGWPIQARPVGQAERLWRWCRRNPAVAGLSAGVALSLTGGTVVSTLFAVQAHNQAALARQREEETGIALARAEEALADGLLRPQGIAPLEKSPIGIRQVNAYEWQALVDLASLPPEQSLVRPLFIRKALETERKAGQLGRRLKPILQAVVGTNPQTRRQVLDVAAEAMQDERRPRSVRLVAARILVGLDGAEGDRAARVMDVLLRGLLSPAAGTEASDAWEAIEQLGGRSNSQAAFVRFLFLLQTEGATQLPAVSAPVVAAARKGSPDDARKVAAAVAGRATELAREADDAASLQALAAAVADVAGGEKSEATRAATAAIARRAVELVPKAHDAATLASLASVITSVGGKENAEATRPVAAAVAGRALELAPAANEASQLATLSRAVSAVVREGNAEVIRPAAAAIANRAVGLVQETRSEDELQNLADTLFTEPVRIVYASGRADNDKPVQIHTVVEPGPVVQAASGRSAVAVAQKALELIPAAAGDYYRADSVREALARVAGRLDRDSGNALADEALRLLPRARATFEAELLMAAWAAAAGRSDHENPAAVIRQALVLVGRTRDADTLNTLLRAVTATAGRLDREAVAAVARQILELVPRAEGSQLRTLSDVVSAVAGKENADATRTAAAAVVPRAVELVQKTKTEQELHSLANTFFVNANQTDRTASGPVAAAVVRRALGLIPSTTDPNHVEAVKGALAVVAGRLDREGNAVADQALQMLGKTGGARRREMLMAAWAAAAGRSDHEDPAAVVRRALELLKQTQDPATLKLLASAVVAVANLLDRESAAAVVNDALERMVQIEDGETFQLLVTAIGTIRDNAESGPNPEAGVQFGRQLLLLGSPEGNVQRKAFTAVLGSLLRGASVKSLAGLLKHPACVGLLRDVAVEELGRQRRQPFGSVWEAVAWLQQQPGIDLNSPPNLAPEPLPGG